MGTSKRNQIQKRADEDFKPLYDRSYLQSANEWISEFLLWSKGEHPDQLRNRADKDPLPEFYWDWNGSPPDKDYHRPEWTGEETNGFCLYETVSEGTPVSPVFPSLDELAEYLAEHGDFWDQKRGNGGWGIEAAKSFCKSGWAPSFIGTNSGLIEGKLYLNKT